MPRILVIAPSWIGDTVLAQPLFRRLHEIHPRLTLDSLAPRWTAPLLRRMPEINDTLDSPFAHGELALRLRLRIARELRARRYDQAIVLPNSFKSALIPFFAGIALRTGYVGEARFGLLNDARRLDKARYPRMVERFAALADGTQTSMPTPTLTVDEAQRLETLHRLGLTTHPRAAVFCIGAEYGPAKRWPPGYFAQLARMLGQKGLQVWLLGSPKERELGEQVVRESGASCRNLCGHTALAEVVDVIASAAYVVTNDSGLMHIAAALDKPMLALYGSSSPIFTPPLSERAKVIKLELPCSPCFKRVCPLGHFNCMMQLTPDRIFEEIEHMQIQ
ncbi:MAG: lipopolysaccharide heptosyltransferase II [Burkholderiales bacterium]